MEEKELQELDVDELLGKKSEPKKETSVPFYIKNEEKELDELDFSEIYKPNYVPRKTTVKDFVFFGEDDREEENEYTGFGKHFLEILAEDEAKKNKEKDLPGYRPGESEESKYLLSPTVRASMQRSENMYNVYKSGEEWLMSDEGGDDLVKGFINNVRSAIGSGVEDFAYLLNDIAPWYTPAKKVVEDNMAGEIEEQAQRNFGNARANGVNGKFVDAMDGLSKGLGYNVFGLKAGNYIQDGADTFNEYRNLRDSGLSREETFSILAKRAPMYILSNKADDYIGKNSGIDEALYGKNGIVSKTDDTLSDIPKKSTIAERIEKGEISSQIHKGQQRKHIEGTKEYRDKYKDGSNPQDILTISMEEAQELVNKYGGKGDPGKRDINGIWTEFADADYVVGKYYSNGEYHETKRFTIHYSKKGAHVIPVRPKGVMKK